MKLSSQIDEALKDSVIGSANYELETQNETCILSIDSEHIVRIDSSRKNSQFLGKKHCKRRLRRSKYCCSGD